MIKLLIDKYARDFNEYLIRSEVDEAWEKYRDES